MRTLLSTSVTEAPPPAADLPPCAGEWVAARFDAVAAAAEVCDAPAANRVPPAGGGWR